MCRIQGVSVIRPATLKFDGREANSPELPIGEVVGRLAIEGRSLAASVSASPYPLHRLVEQRVVSGQGRRRFSRVELRLVKWIPYGRLAPSQRCRQSWSRGLRLLVL